MLYRALVLALATSTHAWNDCAFPDVGYYVVDEGEPPPPLHLHHPPTTTTAISNSPPPQPPTTSTTTTPPPPHRRHRHLLRVRRGGDERKFVHRRLHERPLCPGRSHRQWRRPARAGRDAVGRHCLRSPGRTHLSEPSIALCPSRCPCLSPRPPQPTEPLCRGDEQGRQDDKVLALQGLGDPRRPAGPW
jgi:hypothetical protein